MIDDQVRTKMDDLLRIPKKPWWKYLGFYAGIPAVILVAVSAWYFTRPEEPVVQDPVVITAPTEEAPPIDTLIGPIATPQFSPIESGYRELLLLFEQEHYDLIRESGPELLELARDEGSELLGNIEKLLSNANLEYYLVEIEKRSQNQYTLLGIQSLDVIIGEIDEKAGLQDALLEAYRAKYDLIKDSLSQGYIALTKSQLEGILEDAAYLRQRIGGPEIRSLLGEIQITYDHQILLPELEGELYAITKKSNPGYTDLSSAQIILDSLKAIDDNSTSRSSREAISDVEDFIETFSPTVEVRNLYLTLASQVSNSNFSEAETTYQQLLTIANLNPSRSMGNLMEGIDSYYIENLKIPEFKRRLEELSTSGQMFLDSLFLNWVGSNVTPVAGPGLRILFVEIDELNEKYSDPRLQDLSKQTLDQIGRDQISLIGSVGVMLGYAVLGVMVVGSIVNDY